MITIDNLIKSYDETPVLKGLNLHVHAGDIYGFLGRNGAGKTTTLNIITRLISYNSGTVTISEGVTVGYLPESPQFYDYMTAREYLSMLGQIQNQDRDSIHNRVSELLALVNLEKVGNRRIRKFSRGMKQRLGIASILYHDPDLLLLDEPTSALDPQGRKDIMDLIKELSQLGKTIFFSTHILSDVEKLCTRVGILDDGQLIMEDALATIMQTDQHYEIITDVEPSIIKMLSDNRDIEILDTSESRIEIKVHNDAEIIKILAHTTTRIKEVRLIKPTLEDIFVKAVE